MPVHHIMDTAILSLFEKYKELLKERPLETKAITSCAIGIQLYTQCVLVIGSSFALFLQVPLEKELGRI